jgi:DNA-binding response OmpR family regulator
MDGVTQREQPLIVVVEDDVPIVDLLIEILKDEGYKTVCCTTVEDGFRNIKKEKPDLIILDLRLKGSDSGLTLLELLRLTPPSVETPVIVCSADTRLLKEKEQELQSYNCDVLVKPFDLEEFLQKARSNIGSSLRVVER